MSKEEEGKSSYKDEGKQEEGKASEDPLADEAEIKLILLGDSAVGKTKMVERFLMDEYNPQQVRALSRCFVVVPEVTREGACQLWRVD